MFFLLLLSTFALPAGNYSMAIIFFELLTSYYYQLSLPAMFFVKN